jgi:glycosyltransferase involved in cell wall biosynthesis
VVSSKLEERVRALGVPPERITLTPNAVEPGWLDEAERLAAKPLPSAFAGLPVIGYVGGFYSWHKVDALVEAARRCRDKGQPSALLLVGDGPDRPRIEEQIQGAGLEDLVQMPGQVHHSELNSWIKAMDICTLPSSNDYCSPMKVFEYMALGKVVLAPDLQNLRDVIDHGENGHLFDVEDGGEAGALSRSLEILLAEEDLRRRIGASAQKTVRDRHTWPHNLRRIFLGAGLADPFPELAKLPL